MRLFHSVIFFLLCWQCIGGEELDNISIETILDQVAIPTKIINDFLQKPTKVSPKKFSSQERIESSTVHYENSNGFVPLIVSTQSYKSDQEGKNFLNHNSETKNETQPKKSNILEYKSASSLGGRAISNLPMGFQNRRSFDNSNNRDEFELLKVSNGTPAVASYSTFHEHPKTHLKSDYSGTDDSFKNSLRSRDRDRGKRVQSYLANYHETEGVDKFEHAETSGDKTQNSYQQEKPRNHYSRNNNNRNYRTQKPTTLNNHIVVTTTQRPSIKTYVSTTEESEIHGFKTPIMVEPQEYKVDAQFNRQNVQTIVSTSSPHNDVKGRIDPVESENEASRLSPRNEGMSRNYESADSRNFSGENQDYVDERTKARRMQSSSRRRPPYHLDMVKKLPKEHRESYDDDYDEQGRKRPSTRTKSSYRPKAKPIQVINEDEDYDSGDNLGEHPSGSKNLQNFNHDNSWSQVTPNVEVSHSSGIELDQIEKPKLHILPVNILSNFDHATALDNSQGFDITNAMMTNFARGGSMISTMAPLMSSSQNYIDQNIIPSSTANPRMELSSVPDVIVGQNSFQTPVRAMLMPNKVQQNMLNQYVQSTMAPAIFAVTPSPSYAASSTGTPNIQMLSQLQAALPMNQQLPASQQQSSSITVSNNGFHDKDSNHNENVQSTTSRSTSQRAHHRKKLEDDGQYIASASLSVDHGSYGQHNHNRNQNRNTRKKNNNNANKDYNKDYNRDYDEDYNAPNNQQKNKQKVNTYVQSTMIPAILHTGIGLLNNQNQHLLQSPILITTSQQSPQMLKANNDAFSDSLRQLQYNIQNNRVQLTGFTGIDAVGGASNNINSVQKAQLPILGSKNVEIVNPNLNSNAFAINQIPATLVTTPIPIFATTGFLAPKQFSSTTQETPVSIQNFLDSLTEVGTQKPNSARNSNDNSFIHRQGSDRPLYNPINFVPNYDLVKSQSILNAHVVPSPQFSQQNVNLIPLVPGGDIYKQGVLNDNRPKLSPDLERYAQEMFKESLRTIYNSQKWNNDLRFPDNISITDNSELAKLRNELLRIKDDIRNTKGSKDVLEAHHTENKVRTTKPGSDYKPDSSIEQSHKHNHKPHSGRHHHHHHSHHHRPHKPEITEYLTPPKPNSFVSKSPFHDKPAKKRPAHNNRSKFNQDKSRPRPRQGIATKPSLDAQASSVLNFRYPIRLQPLKPQYSPIDTYASQTQNYPTFTTPFPDNNQFRASSEFRSTESDFYDMNNQRTHNLMGLLMKNKQLPKGSIGTSYSDGSAIRQFFDEENRQTQTQAFENIYRSFQKKSDRKIQPIPLNRVSNKS